MASSDVGHTSSDVLKCSARPLNYVLLFACIFDFATGRVLQARPRPPITIIIPAAVEITVRRRFTTALARKKTRIIKTNSGRIGVEGGGGKGRRRRLRRRSRAYPILLCVVKADPLPPVGLGWKGGPCQTIFNSSGGAGGPGDFGGKTNKRVHGTNLNSFGLAL